MLFSSGGYIYFANLFYVKYKRVRLAKSEQEQEALFLFNP